MNVVSFLDILSVIGFGAALLVVFRSGSQLLDRPSRNFIYLFLGVYFFVGISNLLEHGGITDSFDPYEDYAEILFIPFFLLFIYSFLTKNELDRRQRVEEALRESERRFRRLYEDSPISLWLEDFSAIKTCIDELRGKGINDITAYFENHPDAVAHCASLLKVIDVNKVTLSMYQAKNKEELLAHLHQIFNEGSYEALKKGLIAIAEGKQEIEYEAVTQTLTGEKICNTVKWSVVPGFEDSFSRVLVSIIDITGRKSIEEALREGEERYRSVVDDMPAMVCRFLSDGTLTFANKYYGIYFNKKSQELINQNFFQFIPEADQEKVRNHFMALNKEKPIVTYEHQVFSPDGSIRWQQWTDRALFDENGNVVEYQSVGTDITEHKRAEEALEKSEKKYRSLVDTALVGIFQSNLKGEILFVNEALSTMLEFESPEAMMAAGALERHKNPEQRKVFIENLMKKGRIDNFEAEVLTMTGKSMHVLLSATLEVDVISGVIMDVTKLKNLEEQLRQAQKMEAIGTLAGGIAHEFNNIMTAIIGYGEFLQSALEEDDLLRRYINNVLASAYRAANLTQGLLAYSRKQKTTMKLLSLNEMIKRIESLLSKIIGEDIELVIISADEDIMVMVDSGQAEQVIMNLVTNAKDAMPDGGVLTISTGLMEMDDEFIKAHGYGEKGTYALLSVIDTGIGMDENTQEKIFEPFFTTKEVGRGTGLGLSMVYGIVKKHNGYIDVKSTPGKGTTFKIYFPIIQEGVEETHPISLAPPLGGKETILIAEDDNEVRDIMRISLEKHGYIVIEAVDGEDAIKKFRENKDSIQLFLTDVVMPKKNGREVYAEIIKTRPDMKVLFMSGYTDKIILEKRIFEKDLTFISKPVAPKELLQSVRDVLDK